MLCQVVRSQNFEISVALLALGLVDLSIYKLKKVLKVEATQVAAIPVTLI